MKTEIPTFRYVELDVRRMNAVTDIKFLFFKVGEKVDVSQCRVQFYGNIRNVINDTNERLSQKNNEHFLQWSQRILSNIKIRFAEWNPELFKLKKELERCEIEILQLQDIEKSLNNSTGVLDNIMKVNTEGLT